MDHKDPKDAKTKRIKGASIPSTSSQEVYGPPAAVLKALQLNNAGPSTTPDTIDNDSIGTRKRRKSATTQRTGPSTTLPLDTTFDKVENNGINQGKRPKTIATTALKKVLEVTKKKNLAAHGLINHADSPVFPRRFREVAYHPDNHIEPDDPQYGLDLKLLRRGPSLREEDMRRLYDEWVVAKSETNKRSRND